MTEMVGNQGSRSRGPRAADAHCWNCKKFGHFERDCKLPIVSDNRKSENYRGKREVAFPLPSLSNARVPMTLVIGTLVRWILTLGYNRLIIGCQRRGSVERRVPRHRMSRLALEKWLVGIRLYWLTPI